MCQNDAKSYDTILKDVKLQTNKKIFFLNITDSLYLSSKTSLIRVIDNWKAQNVLFGLLCINSSDYEHQNKEKEYKSINNQLYEDNWVGVSDTKSGMKEALIKFSNIVRKNYDKLK